ncbi:hypothetical protein J2TS4_32240 [Paenibacillus sp. J2TS4]|nr:hypothetical protein J2TS4_32240 [Paenibacillus sp. J2TS4]
MPRIRRTDIVDEYIDLAESTGSLLHDYAGSFFRNRIGFNNEHGVRFTPFFQFTGHATGCSDNMGSGFGQFLDDGQTDPTAGSRYDSYLAF